MCSNMRFDSVWQPTTVHTWRLRTPSALSCGPVTGASMRRRATGALLFVGLGTIGSGLLPVATLRQKLQQELIDQLGSFVLDPVPSVWHPLQAQVRDPLLEALCELGDECHILLSPDDECRDGYRPKASPNHSGRGVSAEGAVVGQARAEGARAAHRLPVGGQIVGLKRLRVDWRVAPGPIGGPAGGGAQRPLWEAG